MEPEGTYASLLPVKAVEGPWSEAATVISISLLFSSGTSCAVPRHRRGRGMEECIQTCEAKLYVALYV